MNIEIESAVLEKYPETEIGYLVAQVTVKERDPFVEELKQTLLAKVQEKGINATNFVIHPHLAVWRKIYEDDFQVNPRTYRSSLESLLKRVVTGKELWSISNVVDLYNCCSILSLMPMGGYDLQKICGDITIRYAKEGETFQGLGMRETISPSPQQIVYADDARLLCWLWNHKDAEATSIDENTEQIIFFIDSVGNSVSEALHLLSENLEKIQGTVLEKGILNKTQPSASIERPATPQSHPFRGG